jgi:PAS domain-containing protein
MTKSAGQLATTIPTSDTKEQARIAETLAISDLDFRQVVDGIPALITVMNAGGEVEFVNGQVLEYSGKTFEELKSWAISDAVHPDDLPDVVAAWKRSLETGNPFESEHRHRRSDFGSNLNDPQNGTGTPGTMVCGRTSCSTILAPRDHAAADRPLRGLLRYRRLPERAGDRQ